MTDDADWGPNTRLSHGGRPGTKIHGLVNGPVHRGSTVLYPTFADRRAAAPKRMEQVLTYGVNGNATHHALEDMVAAIEGGTRCQIVSSGYAAVTTPLLSYLSAGDHVLMPDSVYEPTRSFCEQYLPRMRIATDFYDPLIAPSALADLIRADTKVLFLESPGSHTFEVQDVPALAAVARARGVTVMMDNTWGFSVFAPFAHGVDVSIQALTKYAGGHSDILLGAVTTHTRAHWETLRTGAMLLGAYASPDDCWLALRGLRTLNVRMTRQAENALIVARWFDARPEVARVLYPALPGAPGHDLWKRDFTGAASLFGVAFTDAITPAQTFALADALKLFGIGASWGGYESLVLPTAAGAATRSLPTGHAGPLVRFHIGLEDPADLIADLERGFAAMRG